MKNPTDAQLDAMLPELLPVQYNLGGAAALEFRTYYCNLFDTVSGQYALHAAVAQCMEDDAVAEWSTELSDAQADYSDEMLTVLFWKRYQAELLPFRVYLSELGADKIIPIGDATAKRILRLMLDDDEHQAFRERWFAQGHSLPKVADESE